MDKMLGKFKWEKFSNIDLKDPFFESLKNDYPEFSKWYNKKSDRNEQALVFNDDLGVGAFLYLKQECEELKLKDRTLPAINRIKIGTLRLSERVRKQRLGEGTVGVALWKWQESKFEEIYLTVFEKHTELIKLFQRFGFQIIGKNERGENVFLKSKKNIDKRTPYKLFPFISNSFDNTGIIPIEAEFHDKLFPYSELKGNKLQIEEETAGNGITKVFIAMPSRNVDYRKNQIVYIYRKSNEYPKKYKSVITSFCTISKITEIKKNGKPNMKFGDFIKEISNKTIFSEQELKTIYYEKRNVIVLELLYNGFFGKGKNVNYDFLNQENIFNTHPYHIVNTKEQFIKVLKKGGLDEKNIIID